MVKCVCANVLNVDFDNELTVFQVEFTGGLGRPQTHGVHNVVPVSWHGSVVWQGQNNLLAGRTKGGLSFRLPLQNMLTIRKPCLCKDFTCVSTHFTPSGPCSVLP